MVLQGSIGLTAYRGGKDPLETPFRSKIHIDPIGSWQNSEPAVRPRHYQLL